MRPHSLQLRIQQHIAELRRAYPRITVCRALLDDWREGMQTRYALRLDVRWPQHQSLISGPGCATAEQAVEAAFQQAASHLAARPLQRSPDDSTTKSESDRPSTS